MPAENAIFRPKLRRSYRGRAAAIAAWLAPILAVYWLSTPCALAEPEEADSVVAERPSFPSTPT